MIHSNNILKFRRHPNIAGCTQKGGKSDMAGKPITLALLYPLEYYYVLLNQTTCKGETDIRNIVFFSVLFIITIHSSCLVDAQEKKLIAVFPTWNPYGYVEDGKAVGFEIETFAAVMKKMKIKVDFLHQPWKRCLFSVKKGKADVVISALKVKDREEYLYYPDEPISISETAFFTTMDKNIIFNSSFEGLKNYTIGVTNGFSYGPAFDSCDFLIKDPGAKTESVVLKVLMGRTDLGVGNIAVIKTIAKTQNASHKIQFLKPLVHSQKLYVGFSKVKAHEELTVAFSKALFEFRKSDEYRSIMKKYDMD